LQQAKPPEQGLSPVVFFVGAGMTGAVAIAWIVTEVMTEGAYDECSKGCNTSYWEKGRNLQIVDRVLLGCTAAGAVVTGVLFYLTDFHGSGERASEKEKTDQALAFMPAEGGGMLAIQGRF
jgi:hypothetical protein